MARSSKTENSPVAPEAPRVQPQSQPLLPDAESLRRLAGGMHANPHALLGVHRAAHKERQGVVIRTPTRGASAAWVVTEDGTAHEMTPIASVMFVLFLADVETSVRYTLRFSWGGGRDVTVQDPYRHAPTVGAMDLHLFGEGTHHRLWETLGARAKEVAGERGTSFTVWAPNARGVSVIGDFNDWSSAVHPMRRLNAGGVWELFIPAVAAGARYKFEIRPLSGPMRVKTDPMGRYMEQQPGNASIVTAPSTYDWTDDAFLAARAVQNARREPMLVYEVHLGSWRRVPEEGNRSLTYREIAPRLAAHCTSLGFTHVELMPIQEHPYGGSWGYQVSGYYAPTSRYGTPDDFRFFVDTLHQAGIGVLLDWVPAHFPKDDFALRRFDGTACYEHEDPRLAEHPEWGTLIFNYGRNEVRSFLLANALYWVEEFHIDGMRVDAVASMLYLDYGREAGQWMRNRFGGRENLDAVSFLKELNSTLQARHPGVVTIAEESTTWPRVTHPIAEGGLGFTFKWNMGWMHDTLDYFRVDPFFRSGAHDQLTFAMMYEYSERFMNPLSHDEVVHLKRSLLEKMPGDRWQKFANLRALLAYAVTRPGKTLFFMGTELAPSTEWNHDASLPWHLETEPNRAALLRFMAKLGALYRAHSAFWALDHEPAGFNWVGVGDRTQSVLSFLRRDGESHALIVLNLTPVPREEYRIGVPGRGSYACALSSDDVEFGGSGHARQDRVDTEDEPYHGFSQSIVLTLPPLSALVLLPIAVVDTIPPRDATEDVTAGKQVVRKKRAAAPETKRKKAVTIRKKVAKKQSVKTAKKPSKKGASTLSPKPVKKVAKKAVKKPAKKPGPGPEGTR